MSTRIGIMARGNLRCIGTPHHLKTKYGHGFSLVVNLLPNLGEEFAMVAAGVDAFIEQKCKGITTLSLECFMSVSFRQSYVLH